MPASARRSVYSIDTYCTPRSREADALVVAGDVFFHVGVEQGWWEGTAACC